MGKYARMSDNDPRRLDVELVRRGLVASRAQARAAIEAGKVLVIWLRRLHSQVAASTMPSVNSAHTRFGSANSATSKIGNITNAVMMRVFSMANTLRAN